jgi:hypothetical protein
MDDEQNPSDKQASQRKKKHHFIPITYLKHFADDGGRVFAYRKDMPDDAIHTLPENIGYIKYYYSQPLPNGGMDDNRLEDYFSKDVESAWDQIVKTVKEGLSVNPMLEGLFKFIGLLHARVPAARDMVEFIEAEQTKWLAHKLEASSTFFLSPRTNQRLIANVGSNKARRA